MKNKIILCVGIFLLLSLINCNSKSELVGKWVFEENHDIIFEFLKDKSGILNADVGFVRFNWIATEDGLLTIIGSEADGKYKYKVNNTMLILSDDIRELKFIRIKK